jgi:hypothetical protein
MVPGCRHDHVAVVVGRQQGMLKSTAIRALCHDPAWFTDNISPDLIYRDTKESLRGKWIIELAEIPHICRGTERMKGILLIPGRSLSRGLRQGQSRSPAPMRVHRFVQRS